jgi:hypothetical protein
MNAALTSLVLLGMVSTSCSQPDGATESCQSLAMCTKLALANGEPSLLVPTLEGFRVQGSWVEPTTGSSEPSQLFNWDLQLNLRSLRSDQLVEFIASGTQHHGTCSGLGGWERLRSPGGRQVCYFMPPHSQTRFLVATALFWVDDVEYKIVAPESVRGVNGTAETQALLFGLIDDLQTKTAPR